MSNPQKQHKICKNLVEKLDYIASGGSPEGIEEDFDRAYKLFISRQFCANETGKTDFSAYILAKLRIYCNEISSRRKVNIEGGERELSLETDAFRSLKIAVDFASDLILPLFSRSSDFSNHVFRDISNLSLAYVDSIVSGVADEYIPPENSLDAKLLATRIGRFGLRIEREYGKELGHLIMDIHNLNSALKNAELHLRAFESVATSRKSTYKKEELLEKLKSMLSETNSEGSLSFAPTIIFPIAHGGTELGLELEDYYLEHTDINPPIVYPLMYSMKTRKQRYPWVKNDAPFLGKSLEGKDVLIAEDWVTTGNTLRGIIQQIENSYPHEIRVATLKRDPEQSQVPFLDKYHFYIGASVRYPGKKTDSLEQM